MKAKKIIALLTVVLAVLLVFSSCAEQSGIITEPISGADSSAASGDIDSISFRDSEAVYADDDDDSVITMYLTVRQGNAADNTNHTWEDVNAHSMYYYQERGIDKYRVAGIIQVGDENGPVQGMFGYDEFYPNCTVQIRGATSTRSPQKSYKIEINKNEGYWRGQRTINLNKHVYDAVRFRNKLSYDLLKTIPDAFSARTQFVHLYVKDETEGATDAKFVDYGLYTQAEQINRTYLKNHGLDSDGQLYKATMFEFMRYLDNIKLKDDPAYDKSAFEEVLEIKGNDDHTKLIEMLDAVNNYSIPIEDVLAKYFDEENYFTWFAFQLLTGNIDTTSQNFFLYSPHNGNKWYFISWDNDAAWSYGEDITYNGKKDGYDYTLGVSNYWGVILHQRVLKSDTLRAKLTAKMDELYKSITKERVTEMVNTYAAITKPYINKVPDSIYVPSRAAQFDKIIKMIPDEMEYNYQYYKMSLTCPMPFYVATPEFVGEKTVFSWDPSYDFGGEEITYKFELARDYTFANPLSTQDNLTVPQAFFNKLEPGQYFMRITCKNASGMTQTAMENYQDENENNHFGVIQFYVNNDGTIMLQQ